MTPRLLIRHILLVLFGILTLSPLLLGQDKLYDSFRDPPAQARPFVRWWWNGGRVTEKEILRELDMLKQAGVGGVEINTIAMPEAVPAQTLERIPAVPWLGPEWNRLVKAAAEGARERGLTADLIVGSGWPFGGRFLTPAEQTKRIRLVKKPVTGPASFRSDIQTLAATAKKGADEVSVAPKLFFLRLVPDKPVSFAPGRDLLGRVLPGGKISFVIPAGRHTLYCGILEEGFTHVKLGAPGADGPVVDHFDAGAVRKYLDNMSGKLAPELGGKLGSVLRAMFVDSLELDHANWTSDFSDEFRKRRGYDLQPYLPFVLDLDIGQGDTEFDETTRRARYDFCKTLIELFHERFLKTYIDWCHENGVLGRIQAYGRETHPLNGSMLVDLPEGESWLWSDDDRVVPSPTVVNKYVSSAAHLAGKPTISFEAMTNAVPVFRETLEDFKLCYDESLMSGVIHPVVHGFNYSPPEAGFPGWVRFGCYLNEQDPWWPHFRLWADYAARLSSVLLQTEPAQASVAILGPRADEWSRHFLLYQPFPEVALPWYHYHLWQALNQVGLSSDFVSEEVIRGASFESGKMIYRTRNYQLLILEDVQSLEPETAEAIEAYLRAGGKVVFAGQAPSRSPGLRDAYERDQVVRNVVKRIREENTGQAWVVPAPEPSSQLKTDFVRLGLPDEDRSALLAWSSALLQRINVQPQVGISPANTNVLHVHHRDGEREVFLLANTSRENAAEFTALFPTGERAAWRWDPETGERRQFGAAGQSEFHIQLQPAETLLLVFEPTRPADAVVSSASLLVSQPNAEPRLGIDGGQVLPINAPWRAEFRHVIPEQSFNRTLGSLGDVSRAKDDPAVSTFAGTVSYRTEFQSPVGGPAVLDLGKVYNVSEVWLNGRRLGVRWWGRHVYETQDALRAGANEIEIRVTTMLGNYCRSLADTNPVAKRWAFWFPPIAAGLVGPVTLTVESR